MYIHGFTRIITHHIILAFRNGILHKVLALSILFKISPAN